jgi:hypothetical protein
MSGIAESIYGVALLLIIWVTVQFLTTFVERLTGKSKK